MGTRDATIQLAQRATRSKFGEATQYSVDGPAIEVRGVFDEAYQRVGPGKAGVQSSGPAVFYMLGDLPSDPQESDPSIVIRGTTYKVAEVKKDGQGGVLLLLHRS